MTERTVLHVRLVGLHAAVAVAGRPELAKERFVVAQTTPGARVMDVSPLAQAAGVRPGAALWEARAALGDLPVVPPDVQGLGLKRADAMDVMLRYTPQLQPRGHDEVFMDVTGSLRMCGGLPSLLDRLQADMAEEIGILPAIGVGPNALLARIAGRLGAPTGVSHLPCPATREGLAGLPVDLLWVVAAKHRERLVQMGVSTFGQLSCLASFVLAQEFGPAGKVMFEACRGRDNTVIPVYELGDPRLAVHQRIDLAHPTRELAALRPCGLGLAQRVAQTLRQRGQSTRRLELALTLRDRKSLHRARRLTAPADLDVELGRCVEGMLQSLQLGAGQCVSMELWATDLRQGPGAHQPSLFDEDPRGEMELAAARDRIPTQTGGIEVVPGTLVNSRSARTAA